MNSKYVVVVSPLVFLRGRSHDANMVHPLVGLKVKATPFQPDQQGDLFARRFYTIAVEDVLEALLTEDDTVLNYWIDFWVRSETWEPFTLPFGFVRELTAEELHGV